MSRTFLDCSNTAHQLLSGEFDNFGNNPADYCKSLGWHKDSPGTKKAIKKGKDLVWDAHDTEALAKIIQNSEEEDLIDVIESNDVQDFITNCVAKHIQA